MHVHLLAQESAAGDLRERPVARTDLREAGPEVDLHVDHGHLRDARGGDRAGHTLEQRGVAEPLDDLLLDVHHE